MKVYTDEEKWELFSQSFKSQEGYWPNKKNKVHQQIFEYFKSGFNWKKLTDCLR
jgi:hypothetical protein